jgi:lysozyme
MKTELIKQLRGDEGEEACVYQDHLGYWTIGVGRLVDKRKAGAGLRPHEISFLLVNDVDDRIGELQKRIPWFDQLDPVRQGVLLNMSFQMGVDGLLGFTNTLRLVSQKHYDLAATNMLKSKWASQTPERALRMAEQMRTGRWVYA